MTMQTSIAQVTAEEFRIPSSRRPGSKFVYESNTLVRLTASSGQRRSMSGIGEANPRLRSKTFDHDTDSWRFLKAATELLAGTQVVPCRSDLERVMDNLRELAASVASPDMRQRSNGVPYRGILAGLDTAISDLAARLVGVSLAEFLGGRSSPVELVGSVPAWLPQDRLHERLAATAHTAVIKLEGVQRSSRGLKLIGDAAAATNADTTLWLEPAGELAVDGSVGFVETLQDELKRSELPRHIMVSVRSTDTVLQRLYDFAPSKGDFGHTVDIIADVSTDEELSAALAMGVGAVQFIPARAGGALAVLKMAERLHEEAPDTRVGLSTVPYVSGISTRATADLAAALPRLDYCALPASSGKGVIACYPAPLVDENQLLHPAGGHGLGTKPVVAPAVGHLRRHLQRPDQPPEAPTYHDYPANYFNDLPLLPLTNANNQVSFNHVLTMRAALLRGLNTTRIGRTLLVTHDRLAEPLFFTPAHSSWNGMPGQAASLDKNLTRQLLEAADVPVPQGRSFQSDQTDEAFQYARSLGKPVVVKPTKGINGRGVSVNLLSAQDIHNALELLSDTSFANQEFIIETYISGDDYRILVVGGRVVSVVLKKMPEVIGDGRSTVSELVLSKNKHRLTNPHTRGALIKIDAQARSWLSRQQLSADSVPAGGMRVRLGSAGNIGLGGESIEVLDETDQSILDLAVKAVRAIPGLDYAGVDLMGDHRVGIDRQHAAVIEVNGNPAVSFHHFPLAGTPRDVSSELLLRGCELAGYAPGGIRESLNVRIAVHGDIQRVGYRKWFAEMACDRGVTGSIHNLVDGSVEASASGPANDVWTLAAMAFRGPHRATVDRVHTAHVTNAELIEGFQVSE